LSNLKNLLFLDAYNLKNIMNPYIYINSISKCKNLESLEIRLNMNYFPKEFLKLNLKDLVFYSIDPSKLIEIPSELANMKSLEYFEIPTTQNIIIYDDKMIILKFKQDTVISDNIKYLKIFEIDGGNINNLPSNIEFLEFRILNELPLNNLPIGLKKLTIYVDEVEIFNNEINDYVVKKITEDDIKLPFGCELYIHRTIVI
jgi:hypothetical protein